MGKEREILIINGRRIIPTLFDAQFLLENHLIATKEIIDNSVYQVSNFATNIELLDDYNTKLIVRPNSIGIYGNFDNIIKIYNIIKEQQGEIEFYNIEYFLLFHFEEAGIFKKTVSEISSFEFLNIDLIKFSKENHFIKLKECATDKLHIEITKELEPELYPMPLNKNPFDVEKEIKDTNEFANLLFSKFLKLNI